MHKTRPGRNSNRILIAVFWVIWLAASIYLLVTFLNPFSLRIPTQTLTSLDWAGYSVASDFTNPQTVVTSVDGSWTVPEVIVSQTDTFSAAWIGIGGQLDETLIQTGTEHDCINGTEEYFAWYELLPDPSIGINMNISAGDKITASIKLLDSAANEWAIEITDITNGQSFQQNVQYDSPRLSAEWIVERPTINQNIGTLADFGSITFTASSATVQGNDGPIKDFSYAQIIMQDRQNRQLVTVSSLSADGSSFTVTYSNSVATAQTQLDESLRSNMAITPRSDLAVHSCPDSKASVYFTRECN